MKVSFFVFSLRFYLFFAICALSFCFIFIPGRAFASVTPTPEGCFFRSQSSSSTKSTFKAWMKAPTCTVSLANGSTTNTVTLTVSNINPAEYVVYVNGTLTQSTFSTSSLTSTFTVQPNATALVYIGPWTEEANDNDFYFVGVSDTQGQPGGDLPNPIFEKIMQQVGVVNPPFVLNAGDLIKGEVNASLHEADYNMFDDVLQTFPGSMHPVPGDHDTLSPLADFYDKLYGSNHDISFVYGNTRFIGMSSVEDMSREGALTEPQFAWLENELEQASEEHIVFYMQHPLVVPSWSSSRGSYASQRNRLAGLLSEHGVEIYLTGDAHGYDSRTITSATFSSVTTPFQQVVMGGGGGKLAAGNPKTHHFILFHVSPRGITHTVYEYDDVNVSLVRSTSSRTQASQSVTVSNTGSVDLEYIRVPLTVKKQSNLVVSDDAGKLYTPLWHTSHGSTTALVDLAIPKGTTKTLTLKEPRNMVLHATNVVNTQGVIDMSRLNQSQSYPETTLRVRSASATTAITITEWNAGAGRRTWKENTSQNARTEFEITGLIPYQPFTVFVHNRPQQFVTANGSGVVRFSHRDANGARTYALYPNNKASKNIGVLPAQNGAPEFKKLNGEGSVIAAKTLYSSQLRAGYTSQWVDADGNNQDLLAVAPNPGTPGHVRILEPDGDVRMQWYPFGTQYKGGLAFAAGDVNGDGKEELVVATTQKKPSLVRVYSLDGSSAKRIDEIRPFGKSYGGGLTIAAGDVNADSVADIVVGGRATNRIALYAYNASAKEFRALTSRRVFTKKSTLQGVDVATAFIQDAMQHTVIAAPLSGKGAVEAYSYSTAKKTLGKKISTRPFGKTYADGYMIVAGNVDGDYRDEIIVATRGGDSCRVAAIDIKGMRVRKTTKTTVTNQNCGGGLSIATVDTNGNGKQEVMVGARGGSDSRTVSMLTMQNGALKRKKSFPVYGEGYTQGVVPSR